MQKIASVISTRFDRVAVVLLLYDSDERPFSMRVASARGWSAAAVFPVVKAASVYLQIVTTWRDCINIAAIVLNRMTILQGTISLSTTQSVGAATKGSLCSDRSCFISFCHCQIVLVNKSRIAESTELREFNYGAGAIGSRRAQHGRCYWFWASTGLRAVVWFLSCGLLTNSPFGGGFFAADVLQPFGATRPQLFARSPAVTMLLLTLIISKFGIVTEPLIRDRSVAYSAAASHVRCDAMKTSTWLSHCSKMRSVISEIFVCNDLKVHAIC